MILTITQTQTQTGPAIYNRISDSQHRMQPQEHQAQELHAQNSGLHIRELEDIV